MRTIDTKQLSTAKRYANALFEVAKDKNILNDIHADLCVVSEALTHSAEFKSFINNPAMPQFEKKDALNKIFKDVISQEVFNLLYLLIEKNRFNIFEEIVYGFELSLDKIRNISRVTVTSAVKLDDEDKQKLKAKLETKLGSTVEFDYEINSNIIAGLIIKIGDRVIDGSLKTKLENLKSALV